MNWMSWARQRVWSLLAIGSLLAALLVSLALRSQHDYSPYLDQNLLGGVTRFEPALNAPPAWAAYRTEGGTERLVGYVALGSAPGYAGPVMTRAIISPEGRLLEAQVVANSETPGYIRAVLNSDFLKRFRSKKLSDAFAVGTDMDAVTRATISSQAIAEGVRQSAHALGRSKFGLTIPEPVVPISVGLKELVLAALLVLAVIGMQLGSRRLRWVVQIGSTVFVGFWFNSTISITNIGSLFLGFVPPWRQNLWWYIWVIGIPLVTLVRGTSLNCTWLCPFGATQDLLAKVGGGQVKCRPQYETRFRKVKFVLAWLALMLVFVTGSPGVAAYEPFGTLFGFQGLVVQWATLIVILIGSLFVHRLWCNYFCPVAVVNELTWGLGRQIRKLFRRSRPIDEAGEAEAG